MPRFALCLSIVSACLAFVQCGRGPEKVTRREVPTAVKVEVREEGVAYLPGASQPFTGEAIDIHAERPAVAKRTPYVNGRRHGKLTTWTPGGKLREERTYENGRPLSSIVYHSNGQKKIEVGLNEKDLAEGPYRRWHDNGVLQVESAFDEHERFHGEEKNYDPEGKLVAHYKMERGHLKEIIFETPEQREEREKHFAELEKAAAAAPKQ
ncbi:MAG: toxin-antitoxin system YwqK family antitoxin [Verrucomicrobiales bacterium]